MVRTKKTAPQSSWFLEYTPELSRQHRDKDSAVVGIDKRGEYVINSIIWVVLWEPVVGCGEHF